MRPLATIQKVVSVTPIPGADAIETLGILGWKVVAKKGEFKVDDAVVFVEVDAILPERPEFDFMRSRGFRVRTVRLKKQLSQGLCFPLSILDGLCRYDNGEYSGRNGMHFVTKGSLLKVGYDVTFILGITQYEPPAAKDPSDETAGNFPAFIRKTDAVRIQAAPDVLTRHKGKMFYASEKADGSSITMFIRDGEFRVCSRNLEKKDTVGSRFWDTAKKEGWPEKLKLIAESLEIKDVAVQGELIGPGIQGNKYGLKEREILAFDIFDIDNQRYVNPSMMLGLAELLDFKTVPFVRFGTELHETVDSLVEFSTAPSYINPKVCREGVVFKATLDQRDEELGRLAFKIISPEFLLKNDE